MRIINRYYGVRTRPTPFCLTRTPATCHHNFGEAELAEFGLNSFVACEKQFVLPQYHGCVITSASMHRKKFGRREDIVSREGQQKTGQWDNQTPHSRHIGIARK